MTSEMPGAGAVPSPEAAGSSPAPQLGSSRAAQFLATEHWSLLATRSMSWNESFARSSMFLTSLSTATVALALVGSATDFGHEFVAFALVVLSITLFLGLATFARLVQVNNEDLYWVAGMNRLRGVYARLEPGIDDEFVAGTSLDVKGFALTYGAMDVTRFSPLHVFVTTPGVVAIVSAVIGGVITGLLTIQAAPSMTSAIGVGLAVSILMTMLLILYERRESRAYLARMIRFQDTQAKDAADRAVRSGPRP